MSQNHHPALRLILALLSVLLLLAPPIAAHEVDPPSYTTPPLAGPEHHRWEPVDRSALLRLHAQGPGLKAVAMVGDVGAHTSELKNDMDKAVAALQQVGFTVERFYHSERTFTWSDVVAAAAGGHILLYMGHGIKWGGTWAEPTLVGGFAFGDEFVHPDQIRSDLAGWMAHDSLVILSHVCYSAGHTASDGPGQPSQAEAARRVRMYAAPFVDIGMKAYFANNYYESAAHIVHGLLSDQPSRRNVGEVFRSVYPYNLSRFRDLTYPDAPGYDLWLSGANGDWHDAFVGIPDHVFTGEPEPAQLGPLPAALGFTYNRATGHTSPHEYVLSPSNVAGDTPLTWSVSEVGDWFTVSETIGTSPEDRIVISPLLATVAGLAAGEYVGQVTVTVTDPPHTTDSVQSVDLALDVVVPMLAQLPDELRFTHLLPEGTSLPSVHRITPANLGSDDQLTWQVTTSGEWFTVAPRSGETPQSFTVEPAESAVTQPGTYTGLITVTVTAPAGTEDTVQTIRAVLDAQAGDVSAVYLPLVVRAAGS